MVRKGYKPLYVEVPEDLWKQFAMTCLKIDKTRTKVILELIDEFTKKNK